jgi:SAM-dependent methyltransferase
MLTVRFDRLGMQPGDVVLDLGSGPGRHAREAIRRGARVVALDLSLADLKQCRDDGACAVQADALRLPFPDGAFDRVIAAEVLEHIPDDAAAIAELVRVVRVGGTIAVTVPRWWPERVCWALSEDYHSNEGGHVRIYRRSRLRARLRAAGLAVGGSHHAHALHAPYWWLKCAIGDAAPSRAYHRALVWDLMRKPLATRALEAALNPVLGKSLVLYGTRC